MLETLSDWCPPQQQTTAQRPTRIDHGVVVVGLHKASTPDVFARREEQRIAILKTRSSSPMKEARLTANTPPTHLSKELLWWPMRPTNSATGSSRTPEVPIGATLASFTSLWSTSSRCKSRMATPTLLPLSSVTDPLTRDKTRLDPTNTAWTLSALETVLAQIGVGARASPTADFPDDFAVYP